MSVKQYIEKDNTLSRLHYLTVYQTIMALVVNGVLKVSDLK